MARLALVQALQKLVEQAVGILVRDRPSSKGAAKRRGNSGLVGQAFDMDDTPFHLKLARRLSKVSFAGH